MFQNSGEVGNSPIWFPQAYQDFAACLKILVSRTDLGIIVRKQVNSPIEILQGETVFS